MVLTTVLFDLDGTLADTALDLGQALNALLAAEKRSPLSLAVIRPQAGHGSGGLIKLGFGLTAADPARERLQQQFLEYYCRYVTDKTILFPGINRVLKTIISCGLSWGIVTNKAAIFTDKLVSYLPFFSPPQVVVSGDTVAAAKPSPLPLLFAAAQLKVPPQSCLYVGDSRNDVLAAQAAGMSSAAALWGYLTAADKKQDWGEDYRLKNPAALIPLISAAARG